MRGINNKEDMLRAGKAFAATKTDMLMADLLAARESRKGAKETYQKFVKDLKSSTLFADCLQ